MRQEIIGIDFRVLCHGLSLIAILINARLCVALSGGFFVPVAVLRPAGSGRNLRRGFPALHLYSIHAPHVGSDRGGAGQGDGDAISIPAPRVGSDSCVADVGTGEREETRLLN